MAGAVLVAMLFAIQPIRVWQQIRDQSSRDEAREADVILILGAAEYNGRPSPVLKARLDHGLELYRKGLAPLILTTGGAGGDPMFTEGGVGRAYLIKQGVPAETIIVEMEGETTMHSTAASAEIMRRMGLESCIVVSDGYHIFRAKRMLEARGLKVYGSPRSITPKTSWREWWLYARQAFGYILWTLGITI
jgi:uncharacterized SAM-binding protein YcdF (DUF218 family)